MKKINISNQDCNLLFMNGMSGEFLHASTLDNLGIPYFDTEGGIVDYVERLDWLEDDEVLEVLRQDRKRAQILAELNALDPSLIPKLELLVPNPTRYVEIPHFGDMEERALLYEVKGASSYSRDPHERRAERWSVEDQKTEVLPTELCNWLNELAQERGIEYNFAADQLSY